MSLKITIVIHSAGSASAEGGIAVRVFPPSLKNHHHDPFCRHPRQREAALQSACFLAGVNTNRVPVSIPVSFCSVNTNRVPSFRPLCLFRRSIPIASRFPPVSVPQSRPGFRPFRGTFSAPSSMTEESLEYACLCREPPVGDGPSTVTTISDGSVGCLPARRMF